MFCPRCPPFISPFCSLHSGSQAMQCSIRIVIWVCSEILRLLIYAHHCLGCIATQHWNHVPALKMQDSLSVQGIHQWVFIPMFFSQWAFRSCSVSQIMWWVKNSTLKRSFNKNWASWNFGVVWVWKFHVLIWLKSSWVVHWDRLVIQSHSQLTWHRFASLPVPPRTPVPCGGQPMGVSNGRCDRWLFQQRKVLWRYAENWGILSFNSGESLALEHPWTSYIYGL